MVYGVDRVVTTANEDGDVWASVVLDKETPPYPVSRIFTTEHKAVIDNWQMHKLVSACTLKLYCIHSFRSTCNKFKI